MKRVAKARKAFQLSNKKLRRARHLFAIFVRKSCEQDKLGVVYLRCARNAKEAGLYSPNTFVKDIVHSLKRKHWRRHPEFQHWLFGWKFFNEYLTGKVA